MFFTEDMFSQEAQQITRSVMRELLAQASDPDMISFANGLPASEYLPLEALRACFDTVLLEDGANALQYGPPSHLLKEWIVVYMQTRGVNCSVENVFITNGNQQSLTILSRMFLNKGDVAVVEEVTFTGIAKVTKGYGADVRAVPTNLESGIDVDVLEQVFEDSPRPKMAVVISDFHNPLGVSISREKRQHIAELTNHYQIPLVEDDPYSPLRFTGESIPSIKAYDRNGFVFYLGSFSKMLAPSLRLGWMIIPAEFQARVSALREAIDLESSSLMQRVVAQFVQDGKLEAHLSQLNQQHKIRCETMLNSLQEHLGQVASWTTPEGGLFIWVTLPEHVNATEMLKDSIANQVVYIPGGAFAVQGGYQNTIRLNFSKVPPEQIQEGIARLGAVLQSYL